MVRPANSRLVRFEDRLSWIVRNLDTAPHFLRFCREPRDIHDAFVLAVREKRFVLGQKSSAQSSKTWQRAIKEDSVPDVYIDWLCTLFPDLSREQLTREKYQDFEAAGADIQQARQRWGAAIEFLAKNRREVSEVARSFYNGVDASQRAGFPISGFPLITADRWVREAPLELREDTEEPFLSDPIAGISHPPIKLHGLLGDYISYKGSITYRNRKVANIEPQHNGEIFCVDSVLFDDYFIGFKYYLSHYYNYVNTSEVLGAELADWILNNSRRDIPNSFDFRGTPDDAFDFSNRAAYPGINCLSMFLNYGEKNRLPTGNYFLLHKRDETQLQAQNTVHVLPAGGHQPFAKGARRAETAIWRTAVREFFEELFNKEKLYKQPESWEDFLAYKDIDRLVDIFFRGQESAARIFLLGFGLDPVTLKPEVLLAIVIDWARVRTRMDEPRLSFNWEVQTSKRGVTRHQWAELSRAELVRQANGRVQSINDIYLDTLPAGAACMMFSAFHYDQLLSSFGTTKTK